MSNDTWSDQGDAIWNPKGVTHGKSHVVHLNEWLTISHVLHEAIKGNKGIKEKGIKTWKRQVA